MKYGFGVDVGGTTVKLGLFDETGVLLDKREIPTHTENGGERILPDIAAAIDTVLLEKGIDKSAVTGVGIGVPGPINDEGVVNRCVNLNWGVFNLHETLGALTGLRVKGGNDANCAALGEAWKGGGAGSRSSLFVTLGTGVGGGTLLGLGSKLLDVRNYDSIVEMSLKGDLDNVDLYVGDLSKTEDGYMPSKVTAANFGKVTDFSTKEDIAAGLVNMVFQTVGMMSVFAAQTVGLKDIVLIGNLSKVPNIRELFRQVEDLHGVRFHVPEFAEYATALGAALSDR